MLKPPIIGNPKKDEPEDFLAKLPVHQHAFYKDILRSLPAVYRLCAEGIGINPGTQQKVVPFCSPFRVKARVYSPSTQTWSRVVEILTPTGEFVECIVSEGKLIGRRQEAIALLANRGLMVFYDYKIGTVLELIRSWKVPSDAHSTLIEQVGWVPDRDAFALTSGRLIGRPGTISKYTFGGTENGKEVGNLELWRDNIATLAVGNPNLIFGIALGFSTALMPYTDLNTIIFHFFGDTTKGKTRVLRVALTVWPKVGTREKTWEGTANGLEGEIAKSHSILLGLDELRGDATPDLPAIIYKFANGSSKARGKKEGGTHDRATWNTAVISTGEHSFAETVKALGTLPTGGQGVRMLDIPAESTKGVFENLHGSETSDDFVSRLDSVVKKASGPAGAAFVEQLLALPEDDLEEKLVADMRKHVHAIQQHLGIEAGDDKTAEIRRVIRSYTLVSTAGEWATDWGLTGWEPGTASEAVKIIARRWLDNRLRMPMDEIKEIETVRDYLATNETRFNSLRDIRPESEAEILGYRDNESFYVLAPAFSVMIENGNTFEDGSEKNKKQKKALTALVYHGYLKKHGESFQYRMPSKVLDRPYAYRIDRSILKFDKDAEITKKATRK